LLWKKESGTQRGDNSYILYKQDGNTLMCGFFLVMMMMVRMMKRICRYI